MKGISERDGDTSSVSVATASKPQFEAQRDKFNKEARRLRRLRHPGIVHVEDLFDENGTSTILWTILVAALLLRQSSVTARSLSSVSSSCCHTSLMRLSMFTNRRCGTWT